MARIPRLKVIDENACYHIISRTVGQEFLLGENEKEKLFHIIKKYSELFFVKVIGFAIMSNHFHLLVCMETGENCSDREVIERLKKFYEKKDLKLGDLTGIRNKLRDLSEYIKCIKQTFSFWYNRRNNRKGYFWCERFKSVLIEKGEGLLNCLGYIDLNPVRAGIVQRPEDYRWCSLWYRAKAKNRDGFLDFGGIFETDSAARLRQYRGFVYRAGGIEEEDRGGIHKSILAAEEKSGYTLPVGDVFRKRLRSFSDGLVLGSEGFIRDAYDRFSGQIFFKKERRVHEAVAGGRIFSIRRLTSFNPSDPFGLLKP